MEKNIKSFRIPRFSELRKIVLLLFLIPLTVFAQISWTKTQTIPSTYRPAMCWTGNQLIVVALWGAIRTSPDGNTWTNQVSGSSRTLRDVAGSTSMVIAVGDSGTILTSPDGIDWTARNSGCIRTLSRVRQTGAQWTAVGDSGTILTSPNGIDWTSQTSGTFRALYGIAWTGSQTVVVGDVVILTSPNGSGWTAHDSIFYPTTMTFGLYDVVWTGTRLVAVGANKTELSSENGIDWVKHDTVGYVNHIIWTGKAVVGSGNPGVMISPDGLTWTWQSIGSNLTLSCIAFTGSQFVVLALSADEFVSPEDLSGVVEKSRYTPLARVSLVLRNNGESVVAFLPENLNGEAVDITVFSIGGKVVSQQRDVMVSRGYRCDINRFPKGVYTLAVRNKDCLISSTFMKIQ